MTSCGGSKTRRRRTASPLDPERLTLHRQIKLVLCLNPALKNLRYMSALLLALAPRACSWLPRWPAGLPRHPAVMKALLRSYWTR